jgi:hypothetical protein
MIQDLTALFTRDLNKLAQELEKYPNEESIWMVRPEIINPAGNLCLHLVGNLNFYVGTTLGHTGYARDREAEFSSRDVPKAQLVSMTLETARMIERVLPALTPAMLESTYPLEVFGAPMKTGFFMLHLYGHLNWHRGQINYHRRLLSV